MKGLTLFKKGKGSLFSSAAALGLAFFLSALGGYWAAGLAEESLIAREIASARDVLTGPLPGSALSKGESRESTLKDFVAGDPFLTGAAPSAAKVEEPSSKQLTASELYELEGIRLAGTLPGNAIWVEEGGKQRVILQGEKLKGYDLLYVEDDRVILSRGPATVTVYLRYAGREVAAAPLPPPPVARPTPAPALPGVTAAGPGQKGSIPRETVNKLLLDPLDEMKKFRLRPKFDGGKALGVEVQWMDNASFLNALGVEKGDVIQTVNGLEIKNMGDVVNVINSLMGGSNFDVKVLRQGQTMDLNYNIK